MSVEILLIAILIILGFGWLFFFFKGKFENSLNPEDFSATFQKLFLENSELIANQSKRILEGERETIKTDLANKQQVMEKLVERLQQDMSERQKEIRSLEQDRVKTFGALMGTLKEQRQALSELDVSTKELAKVLSNNQTRGAWGERIIEDLLRSNGLVEGVHYQRQAKVGGSSLRPDIALLMPDKRIVPVDVKFPYSEIQKMAEAKTKSAKASHLKQFATDVKKKITKVAEYISPEHNTLDYAILFVPNEMVFSFINQKFPKIVDEALAKRVILVSPFTFLVVARTVIESYRNFMLSDKLKDVIQHVDGFAKEWQLFSSEFSKFGRSIETLRSGFEKLTTTRTRQMERRIEKIEGFRQGGLLEG